MKYLVLILGMFFLFVIPTILATDIDKASVTIEITNDSILFRTTDFGNINDKNFSIEIINGSITLATHTFDIIFERNTTISSLDFASEYIACLDEKSTCETQKGQYDTAWTQCLLDLEKYESGNVTICKDDLDDCNLREKEKDLTIGSKQDKITNLEDDIKGKKNNWIIGGVVGLVIGGLAVAYKYGKIGNPVKETAQGDFNVHQSG